MATQFDGDNLIITLDPVVGGVLTVDVIDDIYEPWKEWVKIGTNSKYIPAFRPSGGDPLTDVLKQGQYTFLNNEEGWRIKPAENDGTYTFIGNLAGENINLPILAPTTGAFTVLINGLQPITQVVNQSSLVTSLGHIQQSVYVNTEALVDGDGSQSSPFNNVTSAIDYAETNGLHHIHLEGDLTLDRNLKNFEIAGFGLPVIATAGFSIDGCRFYQVQLEGTYTGTIIAQECVLRPNFYLNGYFETCGLAGDLFCIDGGQVLMTQCISTIPGLGRPTISMASATGVQLSVRKNGGGLTIKGCNHASSNVTVEVSEGSLTFDNSNTAGNMVARGMCKFVDQTAGATVTDETGFPAGLNITRKILQNKTVTDPVTGVMTVYDDDGITVLFTANIWENVAGTTPYQGNGVDRREALG